MDAVRSKSAYSQPAGDLAGVQTFVNENNHKNLTPNTSKPSKDNWRTRPDAPEHKEQALPVPPDHRPTRDKRKLDKPNQPAFNTPPASGSQPEGKPLHQRTRTLGKPGEEYGTPYIDQGTVLNQRRTMTSGYAPGVPTTPVRRQKKQVGKAKTYYRRYYSKNKGRILSKAKRNYRELKNDSRFELWRQQTRKRPEKFRRKPGGVADPADRSREWREQQTTKQADFLREEGRPSDLPQTWLWRKKNKGTPDGPDQRSEIPDGTTSWVDTPNQRNPSAPGHQPQDYTVDNNPGSAKVIPEGHDFANRMAKRIASRYLTAAKIAEIEGKTSPDILSKAQGADVRLTRVDAPNRVWLFDVKGSEPDPYRVRVKVIPPNDKVRKMDKVDVQLSCTCPFWRWQGPEHWAKQNDYLFGKPAGTASKPDAKDPKGRNWICKHVAAVLAKVKTYDVPKGKTASGLRYLCDSLRLAGL